MVLTFKSVDEITVKEIILIKDIEQYFHVVLSVCKSEIQRVKR